MRDDFDQNTKEILARRVAYRCSNPKCRNVTSGPQQDPAKAMNIGVAAHITAASPGGPRYDASLLPEGRKSPQNGIWLCQNCAKLIDNDPYDYPVEKLMDWKKDAEKRAKQEIEGTIPASTNPQSSKFVKIERLMPELLSEMKTDLSNFPLVREFILFSRNWVYNGGTRQFFTYFFEDHKDLKSEIQILENLGLVKEITFNNVDRYIMSEDFADYLLSYRSQEGK